MYLWTWDGQLFLKQDTPQKLTIEEKIDKLNYIDIKNFSSMGENICKWSNWQRINLQNLQAAHAAQYQKNKQPNPKMCGRPK